MMDKASAIRMVTGGLFTSAGGGGQAACHIKQWLKKKKSVPKPTITSHHLI